MVAGRGIMGNPTSIGRITEGELSTSLSQAILKSSFDHIVVSGSIPLTVSGSVISDLCQRSEGE